MGIDRPDEDDASVVQHDSPGLEVAAPAVEHDAAIESQADRAAYSAEHRRTVEAEYQAAWDEALPAFQADWEEHERKYPYPERARPTVEADGSWHARDVLRLSPEQNAEVDRSGARIREIGVNLIIPGVRDVEAEDASRHLVGFEHRFKEADRLKEKVADRLRSKPGRTPADELAMIPDAVRFTFEYDENLYTAGVRKDIERLEARGFIQVERRNTWTSEQYKGINSRWREPESELLFEVQFHTRISFEAKQLTHKAYERIRTTAQGLESTELKGFQRRVCAMIPFPPGVAEYDDYPPEKRDG